jgi:hypothetical protein
MEKIKQMLIDAQNDLLRMMDNAKCSKEVESVVNHKYNEGFYAGSIKSLEYASKHLTNILEQTE